MKNYNAAIYFLRKIRASVNAKITACFVFLILLVLVNNTLVVGAILQGEDANNAQNEAELHLSYTQTFSQQLGNLLDAYNTAIYVTGQKAVNASYQLQVRDTLSRLLDNHQEFSPNVQTLVTGLDKGYTEFEKVLTEINRQLLAGQPARADQIWKANVPLRTFLQTTGDQTLIVLKAERQYYADQNNLAGTFTKIVAIAVGIVSLFFTLFFAWLLSTMIGKPLRLIRHYLQSVADGDLSRNLQIRNADELGELARMLNLSVENLRSIIDSLNIGTQISDVASNLQVISSRQYQSSQEQALYVSQISTAMSQLGATAVNIAENANAVTTTAADALQQANEVMSSGEQVYQAVTGMAGVLQDTGETVAEMGYDLSYLATQLNLLDLHSLSQEKIIQIITDIANQTHLLALNAAIEAAGAGQYGERFSVIAREVKELANRANRAAGDVHALIVTMRSTIQITQEQMSERQQKLAGVSDLTYRAENATTQALQVVASNHRAAEAIVQAVEVSNFQSNQIKMAIYEQQSVIQEMLNSVSEIVKMADSSAEGNHTIETTSSYLNDLSGSLKFGLTKIRLPGTLA